MSGAEKVAVLLLALGKPRAAKLLKRFGPDDLKILTQLAGDLAPIDASDLEGLVEEFAQKFSSGINFVGTEKEVKSMLSDVMGEDQLAGVMSDEQEEPGEAPERVWDKIARIKDDALRAYLSKEHPQTAAMILSRIDPGIAARIVAAFPARQRNDAPDPHARHQESLRRCGACRGGGHSGGPALPNRRRDRTPASPTS